MLWHLNYLHAWRCFMFVCPQLALFQHFLKKIIRSGTLPGCQTAWIEIRTDVQSVLIWVQTVCISKACADPESFVRRGPTLTSFFLFVSLFLFLFLMSGGERIQITLNAGHHRHTSGTTFKWCFAGGPIMAEH